MLEEEKKKKKTSRIVVEINVTNTEEPHKAFFYRKDIIMREQILNDMKQAMKNQDKETLAVIRMVKGAMQMEELNLKRELNDDEVIAIIAKQIKTRKESIAV
mgnify:FL=1